MLKEVILICTVCLLYTVNCASTNRESLESQDVETVEPVDSTTGSPEPESSTFKTLKVGSKSGGRIYHTEVDTNSDRFSSTKIQKPIANYEKCGENEWFYPGDVDGDWV